MEIFLEGLFSDMVKIVVCLFLQPPPLVQPLDIVISSLETFEFLAEDCLYHQPRQDQMHWCECSHYVLFEHSDDLEDRSDLLPCFDLPDQVVHVMKHAIYKM